MRLILGVGLVGAVLGCSAGRTPRFGTELFAVDDSDYSWDLPAGFPQPRVPADNPMSAAKVELGRYLFYDVRLSIDQTASCASCHRQELAFTDGRPRAIGVTDEVHPRGSMSLANVAYNATYTWADDTVRDLETQMLVPMFGDDPVELGLAGLEAEVLGRLAATDLYGRLFAAAYPEEEAPLTFAHIVEALASFERTLISGNSPYDRLVFGDEAAALAADARRGMKLFFSSGPACFECHAGITFSGPVEFEGSPAAEPVFHNTGLYDLDGRGAYPAADRGLQKVTGRVADMGRFRAPTLRNVALTAPYMHDGSVATLEEVIDHYAAGGRARDQPGGPPPRRRSRISPLLEGFTLSATDRADLVAFLRSLTDERFVADRRFSDPFQAPPRAARLVPAPWTFCEQRNTASVPAFAWRIRRSRDSSKQAAPTRGSSAR